MVALLPAFNILIECTAIICDVLEVRGGGIGIGAVVFSLQCLVSVVEGGQLVIVVAFAWVHLSDFILVAPPDAQDDSSEEYVAKVDSRADS